MIQQIFSVKPLVYVIVEHVYIKSRFFLKSVPFFLFFKIINTPTINNL